MKPAFAAAIGLAVLTQPAVGEETRSADAHEHGHGLFRMAVEADHVEIELEVPAFDIVGFEHAPSTEAQRNAIKAARKVLSDPASLFVLPAAAGCEAEEVKVVFGVDGEHDDHHDEAHDEHGHDEHADDKHDDHGHDDHAAHDEDKHDDHDHEKHAEHDDDHDDHDDHADHDDHDDHAEGEETHSEVLASYELHCDRAAAIKSVEFRYFEAFPNAEELNVVVLSDRGQQAGEIERDQTVFRIE